MTSISRPKIQSKQGAPVGFQVYVHIYMHIHVIYVDHILFVGKDGSYQNFRCFSVPALPAIRWGFAFRFLLAGSPFGITLRPKWLTRR